MERSKDEKLSSNKFNVTIYSEERILISTPMLTVLFSGLSLRRGLLRCLAHAVRDLRERDREGNSRSLKIQRLRSQVREGKLSWLVLAHIVFMGFDRVAEKFIFTSVNSYQLIHIYCVRLTIAHDTRQRGYCVIDVRKTIKKIYIYIHKN